ncbi:MAG: amidase [Rhodobacteraceae bacterium]|nr:amidase [Paracoccaceae bacterium]
MLADLPIAEAGRRLRAGEATSLGLTEAALDRIAARDGRLSAFAEVFGEAALAAAAAADAALRGGADLGPLHGIPVAIKDVIDIAGRPTRAGSRVPMPAAAADAAVTGRLRAAGAVILGAVATYEFATVGPDEGLPQPPACNPWDATRITGGSSSGSAAAVAGGMVRASLGTDTGGSVRAPAAYCGVVGLKPTRGRVPLAGVLPLAPGLDHVGVIAATAAEAAAVLDAISDPGWRPAAGADGAGVAGITVGYARGWFADDPATSPGVLRALDDAASALSMAGARILPVDLPGYAMFETAAALILDAEALASHRDRIAAAGPAYGTPCLRSLLRGIGLDAGDVAAAWEAARLFGARLDRELGRVDVILTATTLAPAPPVAAFRGGAAAWTPMRTLPFNASGHPAIALPAGFDGGLPVGLQLVAPHGAEDVLVRVAEGFERATDHAVARPPL